MCSARPTIWLGGPSGRRTGPDWGCGPPSCSAAEQASWFDVISSTCRLSTAICTRNPMMRALLVIWHQKTGYLHQQSSYTGRRSKATLRQLLQGCIYFSAGCCHYFLMPDSIVEEADNCLIMLYQQRSPRNIMLMLLCNKI